MMLGVVLCGGESKRMGSDKGLLPAGNEVWAERAFSKLSSLDIPVVLSVNAMQMKTYSQIFPHKKLIADTVSAKGPLKGLLSVHKAYPHKDLLVLACDMVYMNISTLKLLKDSYDRETDLFDYYIYEKEGFIEPLCAVYPSPTLKSLHAKLTSGALPSFSLQRLISGSRYKNIPVTDVQNFANYNATNPLC